MSRRLLTAVLGLTAAVAAAALALSGCGADPRPQRAAAATIQQVAVGPPSGGVATEKSRRASVPILMYHVIASPKASTPMQDLWVPADRFEQHVAAIEAAGYQAVTLDHVIDAWNGKRGLPPKPIVFSFDDGYLSQGQDAASILAKRGWPGVLNLVMHALGSPGGLTKTRVKEMIAAGWELDSHSLTHPDMAAASPADAMRELKESRRVLRETFGVPVNSFCYPAGKYDAEVERLAEQAGYTSATTVEPGIAKPGSNRFALPRVRVNGSDSAETVLKNIRDLDGGSAG